MVGKQGRKSTTTEETERLLNRTAARASLYLQNLKERKVAPTPEAIQGLSRLDEPFPQGPTDAEAVLALLDEAGSPATMASAGGRFFGFVVGSSLPVALAANWLASAWDQNAGLAILAPAAARLEEIAGRWLIDLFGLPVESGVGFVTCATQANFAGLAAARHALLARRGWDVEKQGLFAAPEIQVVVGDEVHVSVLKALSLLGLGRERVVRVPVDGQGRMRADALPALGETTIVCLQAGNVNTGAFELGGRHRPAGQGGRRLGSCGRGLRPVGGGSAVAPSMDGRLRRGQLLGDRRAQVAQCAV